MTVAATMRRNPMPTATEPDQEDEPTLREVWLERFIRRELAYTPPPERKIFADIEDDDEEW